MKQITAAVIFITAIVAFVAISFTISQVNEEKKRLEDELQERSLLMAEGLKEIVEPNFTNKSEAYLQGVVDRFGNKERFAGLAIFNSQGKNIASSSTLPKETLALERVVFDAMDENKSKGSFEKLGGRRLYLFAVPVREEESVVGAYLIAQNAGYIDTRLEEIWKNNVLRLIMQAFLMSIAILFILRWMTYAPVKSLVESLKLTRESAAGFQRPESIPNFPFYQPLVREIYKMKRSLIEARISASEEARLRLEKVDSPWTGERLKEFLKDVLKGRNIFVVSNREPYIHTKNGGKISYYFPVSGMATAIEPMMQACEGLWIAHGSGDADALTVDKHDHIRVPQDDPTYTLRRVWLSQKEEQGYYYGFCNEGLWPLCHIAHARPIFRQEDFEEYKRVNGKFTYALLQEIKNSVRPIIFVQDFHLALIPRMIKKSRPDALIGLFWHIPWPNPESFSICPFRKELLYGMLGADLIGFQTQLYCNNFINTIGRELESLIDWERFSVTCAGHSSSIKSFPISIAFSNNYEYQSHDETSELKSKDIVKDLGINAKYICLGVDRLDYTKGILERFASVEAFLDKYKSYREQLVFVQVAPRTRSIIPRYQELERSVTSEADRINNKFKTGDWKPIVLLKKRYSHEELNSFYRMACLCMVTSLHDGMNLVAKEFVAAREDERGVLILSQFTGASRELKDALIVNPYDIEQMATAIHEGLTMPKAKQRNRMRKMRSVVKNYNIYRWSADFLKTLVNLE